MAQFSPDLLNVYNSTFEKYAFNSVKANRGKIINRHQLILLNRYRLFEEALLEKNRELVTATLKPVKSGLPLPKKPDREIDPIPQKTASIVYSDRFIESITNAFRLKKFFKIFELPEAANLGKKLKTLLDKSKFPFIRILLDLNFDGKSILKLPVDVFKQPADDVGANDNKLFTTSLPEWYVLNNIKKITAKQGIPSLKNIALNLINVEVGGKKLTAASIKGTGNLLEYTRHLIRQNKEVLFRLKKGNDTSEWVKIQKTETDIFTSVTGFYFDDSLSLTEFARKHSKQADLGVLTPHKIPNTEKFYKKTHFIPSKYINDHLPIDFIIGKDELVKLASEKKFTDFPLVESKTSYFNLYFDIDLDWKLFESFKELHQLKLQQFKRIAGKKMNFAPLVRMLGQIYPFDKVDKDIQFSSREKTNGKSGFHLIFKTITLKNNELQYKFLMVMLEKYIASDLLKTGKNEITRFLLQAICDDISLGNTHASAIQIDISTSFILSLKYDISKDDFKKLLCEELSLFLKDNKQAISKDDNARLVQFALDSIGEETIDEFYSKFHYIHDHKSRYYIILKLSKRIRWEIMRRIHFFDHSASEKNMGLRVLGSTKPNETGSRYFSDSKRKEDISTHSIRTSKKAGSQAVRFHYDFLRTIEKKYIKVNSLKGLFTKEFVRNREAFEGLDIEFNVPNFKVNDQVSTKNIHRKTVVINLAEVKVLDKGYNRSAYDPLAIKIKNAEYLVYAPKNRKKERVLNRQKLLFSNVTVNAPDVEVRVRVFIPSPLITGPTTQNFGGDNRGPSYNEGTSRVDIDVIYNPASGVIVAKQADWGPSHGYDPDDTVPVAGKPDWWLEAVPGAQPNEVDDLPEVWGDNVDAKTGSNGDNNTLEITYSGALPLEAIAPSIDGTFTLEFDNETGEVTIDSDHDGFPQHTLYINKELVYNYDPVEKGADPFSLGPPTDVQDSKTIPVPPRQNAPLNDDDYTYEEKPSPLDDDDFSYDDPKKPGNRDDGASGDADYDITINDDGSATITAGDNSDQLYYDDEGGSWESEAGTNIESDGSSFDEGMEGGIHSSEGLDNNGDIYFTVEDATGVIVHPGDSLYP